MADPYDVLAIVSFIQGTLTLVAALIAAMWSVTQQTRANRRLGTTLLEKIDQIHERYGKSGSLGGTGLSREVREELDAESGKLDEIKKLSLVDEWLHRDSTALKLSKISDRIDFVLLEFHLIGIRDQILLKITVEPPP